MGAVPLVLEHTHALVLCGRGQPCRQPRVPESRFPRHLLNDGACVIMGEHA